MNMALIYAAQNLRQDRHYKPRTILETPNVSNSLNAKDSCKIIVYDDGT